jgi:hypothetical protein
MKMTFGFPLNMRYLFYGCISKPRELIKRHIMFFVVDKEP